MAKNIRLLSFDEKRKRLKNEKVLVADELTIETKHHVFNIEDVKQYIDDTDSTIYYLVNVDLPVLAEAKNLKQLRRSEALNNIFKYDIKKPLDIFKLLPYLIIIVMIIFS